MSSSQKKYELEVEWARNRGPIIFTNGCFDVLHLGHICLLNFCRKMAEDFYPPGKVIVGLNSDESVDRLKGPDRPIQDEQTRKAILSHLRTVDQVIVFHEDTPYDLIQELQPDYIVKGHDYEGNEVVGSDIAEVVIADDLYWIDDVSTTKILERIRGKV